MAHILLDMDGVLADIQSHFQTHLAFRGIHVNTQEQSDFYFEHAFPQIPKAVIDEIIHSPGFYYTMPVMSGAKEVIEELRKDGHTLQICSSPPSQNSSRVTAEKLGWLIRHFPNLVDTAVITRDKTKVSGDFLLDDKPEPNGNETPSWEHVVFLRSYNDVGFESRAKDKSKITFKGKPMPEDVCEKRFFSWTRMAYYSIFESLPRSVVPF